MKGILSILVICVIAAIVTTGIVYKSNVNKDTLEFSVFTNDCCTVNIKATITYKNNNFPYYYSCEEKLNKDFVKLITHYTFRKYVSKYPIHLLDSNYVNFESDIRKLLEESFKEKGFILEDVTFTVNSPEYEKLKTY